MLDTESLNAISEAIKPYPLSQERKESIRARLLDRINPPPEGTRTVRAGEMKWYPISPLIEVKMLRQDREQKNQTVLLRLKPGAVIPGHMHAMEEECLVLEGEIKVSGHLVRQGDMHICKPGYAHPDIITETGAVLLVRTEIDYQPVRAR